MKHSINLEKYHSLQHTNVRLSGNIKLLVEDDELYLESINSSDYLSFETFYFIINFFFLFKIDSIHIICHLSLAQLL